MVNMVMPFQDTRQLKDSIRRVQSELTKLTTNRYFSHIPLMEIDDILKEAGFPEARGWSKPIGGNQGQSQVQVNDHPMVHLIISWYKMESGRFEVIAYLSASDHIDLPHMASKDRKTMVKRTNMMLDQEINKKYHPSIPLERVRAILDEHGFDGDKLAGLYTGESGRSHEEVGSGAYLTISWFKMPSHNYEITAYVS